MPAVRKPLQGRDQCFLCCLWRRGRFAHHDDAGDRRYRAARRSMGGSGQEPSRQAAARAGDHPETKLFEQAVSRRTARELFWAKLATARPSGGEAQNVLRGVVLPPDSEAVPPGAAVGGHSPDLPNRRAHVRGRDGWNTGHADTMVVQLWFGRKAMLDDRWSSGNVVWGRERWRSTPLVTARNSRVETEPSRSRRAQPCIRIHTEEQEVAPRPAGNDNKSATDNSPWPAPREDRAGFGEGRRASGAVRWAGIMMVAPW